MPYEQEEFLDRDEGGIRDSLASPYRETSAARPDVAV